MWHGVRAVGMGAVGMGAMSMGAVDMGTMGVEVRRKTCGNSLSTV